MVENPAINSQLPWDGSCLGPWTQVRIHAEVVIDRKKYAYIFYRGNRFTVRYYHCTNAYMCMVDEAKTLFNLPKEGTHWFTSGEKCYIIARVYNRPEINELFPTVLLYPDINHPFAKQVYMAPHVQQMIAFRWIMGIKDSKPKDLYIYYEQPNNYKICSTNEKHWADFCKDINPFVSTSIMIDWFDVQTIGRAVGQLTNISDYDSMQRYLPILREQLKVIVNRINKKLISLVDDIIARTSKRLTEIWAGT